VDGGRLKAGGGGGLATPYALFPVINSDSAGWGVYAVMYSAIFLEL
jgi:hypothetical protein